MQARQKFAPISKLPSVDIIRKLVREGLGLNQIADRFGVTRDHTRRRLKELGLNPPASREASRARTIPVMTVDTPTDPVNLPRISMLLSNENGA